MRKRRTMYNEALVNALNADRQRGYDELERLRRQREIEAVRAAEDAAEADAAPTLRARRRRPAAVLRHLAAR
jgi:hypothetical protein